MRWPVGIVCFFLLIAAVNGYIVFKAFTSNNGLIEDNPYERGIAYQAEINRMQAAESAGWRPEIRFPEIENSPDRYLELHAPDTIPMEKLQIRISLKRPNDPRLDIPLQEIRYDKERAAFAKRLRLANGLWLMRVEIDLGKKELLWRERVWVD